LKKLLTILFFFLVAFANAQTDEEKLIATVKEFHQTLVNKNTVSINQQTDKALSYGHSNGWVQTKADIIKDFERRYISYQSFKEDSITVSMNDNMANVRFVADITATLNGTTINNYHLRVLEVWVKKGKRWVLLATKNKLLNTIVPRRGGDRGL
jgi:alpha-D-ribose 1-methylphosphonate 5-phosphate C-P lyase